MNWEKVARHAGYEGLRLHDLRHAHAAGLIRDGVHPRVVQERLGHAFAAFTMQVYGPCRRRTPEGCGTRLRKGDG